MFVFKQVQCNRQEPSCDILRELYNEGLRDLLSSEDNATLKILENKRKNQSGSTLVHRIEETYINSASSGGCNQIQQPEFPEPYNLHNYSPY
jgi:kinesin family protein 11